MSPELPSTKPKAASVSHLLIIPVDTFHTLWPLRSFPPREKGIDAPIEKMKNGNTRSTQVIPFMSGLNTKSGGGTWQWNIHAGSPDPQAMFALITIKKMAMPRITSMDTIRVLFIIFFPFGNPVLLYFFKGFPSGLRDDFPHD